MRKCKNCGQEFGYVSLLGFQAAFGLCMRCERERIELQTARQAQFASLSFSTSPERSDNRRPVICSQAAIACFLGRSKNTAGLLEKLRLSGIIGRYERGKRRTFKVWFTDPEQHEQALKKIPGQGTQ